MRGVDDAIVRLDDGAECIGGVRPGTRYLELVRATGGVAQRICTPDWSQTLQAMRRIEAIVAEMLRVGREAIVTFPNFGHWSHRLQVLRGRMPVSSSLPYQWYDTPNIHLCTVADFDAFLAARGHRVLDRVVLAGGRPVAFAPNLMGELEKIRRITSREIPGAPHETLLVLDATVGQNGVTQAREFTAAAGVTGIVLTKLDGTAKGGVAVAIAHDLKLPIRWVGTGEGIEDLVPFSTREYVDALFEASW